jgi:hypothetical protein
VISVGATLDANDKILLTYNDGAGMTGDPSWQELIGEVFNTAQIRVRCQALKRFSWVVFD